MTGPFTRPDAPEHPPGGVRRFVAVAERIADPVVFGREYIARHAVWTDDYTQCNGCGRKPLEGALRCGPCCDKEERSWS